MLSNHYKTSFFLSFSMLCACGVSAPSGPTPLSDEERSSTLKYVDEAPLVLGALPLAHEGTVDPLVRFAAFPNYAGHLVVIDGSVSQGPGIEVVSNEVQGVVVLYKRGTDGDAVVAAATAEACGESSQCRNAVQRVEAPYSFVELRSISGWVVRSPIQFVSTQTVIVEDAGSYAARVRLTTDESRIEFLREMLMQSGTPVDAWEVGLNRYEPASK